MLLFAQSLLSQPCLFMRAWNPPVFAVPHLQFWLAKKKLDSDKLT
jgi:hypothetical protein